MRFYGKLSGQGGLSDLPQILLRHQRRRPGRPARRHRQTWTISGTWGGLSLADPFFPSPQRDNGYDVAGYRAIDPRFGTMEDLETLVREADKRGIGLMLDMVFNHTSTSHEWFQRALAGEKKYQDYYIFKEGSPDQPPTNWVSKFGGPAWSTCPPWASGTSTCSTSARPT